MALPLSDATHFDGTIWVEDTPVEPTREFQTDADLDYARTKIFESDLPEERGFSYPWDREILVPVAFIWGGCFAFGALGAWMVC